MQSVAVGWQIYENPSRTGLCTLAFVGLAQFLPGICRYSITGNGGRSSSTLKRYCGSCTGSLSGIMLGATAVLHPPAHCHTLAALRRSAVERNRTRVQRSGQPIVYTAAATACEVFQKAVAWSSSTFQSATIAGPMLGGILYGLTGSPVPVYVCAASAYSVGIDPARFAGMSRTSRHYQPHVRGGFGGSAIYLANKILLGASSLDLFAVLLGGAVALLPVYAREILHVGALGPRHTPRRARYRRCAYQPCYCTPALEP